MAKYITAKRHDGVDHDALTRGLAWLLDGNPGQVFIYTPAKRNAQDMATNTPEVITELFKKLLKGNKVTVGSTVINLCFGSGSGSCGNAPAYGSTEKILLCYSDPKYVGWLLTRAPNAELCLLPWTNNEGAIWTATHSPKVI